MELRTDSSLFSLLPNSLVESSPSSVRKGSGSVLQAIEASFSDDEQPERFQPSCTDTQALDDAWDIDSTTLKSSKCLFSLIYHNFTDEGKIAP